jgi:hypothetical protein
MADLALSTLRSRLRIYLNDVNSKTWSDDTALDLFVNHAIIKFTHDVPAATSKVYTIATDQVGDAHTYSLPDDFVRDSFVRGYFESNSRPENIFRINAQPGIWDENDEPRGYLMDWPGEGQFYLPRQPGGTAFTLYYSAYFSTWLTDDTDTFSLTRNRWGEQAVLAYAAYLAFNPSSARRAQLEQWNRKGDANVGNPLEEEANRWLGLYRSLLDEHTEAPSSWEFVPMARS